MHGFERIFEKVMNNPITHPPLSFQKVNKFCQNFDSLHYNMDIYKIKNIYKRRINI